MVLVVVTICAIALTSYLQLVNSQNRAVARSQGWNATVPVMEAGIEEALAHLNKNSDSGLNVDGWVAVGNYYRMERSVGSDYYVVTITITNTMYPIIEARGFCRMPLLVQHNTSPFFVAAAGGNYNSPREGYVGRGVRLSAKRNGAIIKAMLAKDHITISGNVNIDSYDSCDPAKSTGGRYDPSKAGDGGDIASNGQLIKEITMSGSVEIKGHISTGPGGTVGLSGQVSVGDTQWVDIDDRTGIKPGWFRDDMNANIADSPPAPAGGFALPGGQTIDGVYYNQVLSSGTYRIPGSYSMSGSHKILITGDVKLYIHGDLSMSGTSSIQIGPAGSLQMWGNGASVSLSGQGLINQTGDPTRFMYYGTPNNLNVNLSGTSDFIGIIYAPYAELKVSGGSVIHGATVNKKITASGGFTLHYDQCLGGSSSQSRYIVTSWNEMTPPEVAQVP